MSELADHIENVTVAVGIILAASVGFLWGYLTGRYDF